MSDDLVTRLRESIESGELSFADVMDAADEIHRLREQIATWERCATLTRQTFGNCIVPKDSVLTQGAEVVER